MIARSKARNISQLSEHCHHVFVITSAQECMSPFILCLNFGITIGLISRLTSPTNRTYDKHRKYEQCIKILIWNRDDL
jgi:hypothetical protein